MKDENKLFNLNIFCFGLVQKRKLLRRVHETIYAQFILTVDT